MAAPLKALVLRAEKLIARLLGHRYLRRGSCLRCGRCCRRMVLFYNGRAVEADDDFQGLLALDRRYRWFAPLDDDGGGERLYRCTKLGDDGKCRAYRNRLVICRFYPHERIFMYGGELIDGCGYSFEPVVAFRDVMRSVLGREPESRSAPPSRDGVSDDLSAQPSRDESSRTGGQTPSSDS